jgi:hypothetical protein
MELLADPVFMGVLKIVGFAIALVAGIPFIIGIVIGWMLGRAV